MKNLAMAIEAAKICKLKNFNLSKALKNLKTIDGRLELVRQYPNGIKVLITPILLKLYQRLLNHSNFILKVIFLWFLVVEEKEIIQKDHLWLKLQKDFVKVYT